MTGSRAAVTAICWAVLVGALLGSDAQPQVAVLGGVVCVIVAIAFIAFDLARSATPLVWAHAPRPQLTRADDEAVSAMAARLRSSRRSPSASVRDALISMCDERLLDRHGIDRTAQPALAHTVLGPELSALAEQPRFRLSSTADLNRLLDEIEAI